MKIKYDEYQHVNIIFLRSKSFILKFLFGYTLYIYKRCVLYCVFYYLQSCILHCCQKKLSRYEARYVFVIAGKYFNIPGT